MSDFPVFPGLAVFEKVKVALASGSPRRRELLTRLLPDANFVIISADLDETQLPGEDPQTYVRRLALSKAEVGGQKWLVADPDLKARLIIAADTSVVLNDVIYGKPGEPDQAVTMLEELAGKTHQVITGFAARLITSQGDLLKEAVATCTTEVEIRALTRAEIDWYVATGEPLDKAGAYAIQGFGGNLVNALRGDYYNVVGLPLVPLISLLKDFTL
ncbi:MAG: septum formation protein Maf [Chloroflexi bacterium]|nr:septum formation protein Maf [Chloroflexota bacterium]OJV88759.1 MAG: septum formation protein Maf [Chloroflexi bacterium 54-19]